jgi:hypothetical protein
MATPLRRCCKDEGAYPQRLPRSEPTPWVGAEVCCHWVPCVRNTYSAISGRDSWGVGIFLYAVYAYAVAAYTVRFVQLFCALHPGDLVT